MKCFALCSETLTFKELRLVFHSPLCCLFYHIN